MDPNPFRKRKYFTHDERNEIVFKKGQTTDINQAFKKRKKEIEESTPWHKMKEDLIARGLVEPKQIENIMKKREAKHREYLIKDSAKQKPNWESFDKTEESPKDKKKRKKTGKEQKNEDNKEFEKFPRKKTGKEQKNQDPKKFKKLPQNSTKKMQKDKNKKNKQDFSDTLGKSIKENKQLTFRQNKMLKDVITKTNTRPTTNNLAAVVEDLRSKGLVTTHHLKKIFKVKPF